MKKVVLNAAELVPVWEEGRSLELDGGTAAQRREGTAAA